jgi:hypothetical protein
MSDKPREDSKSLETDERFPTGPWTGYFLQPGFPNQFRMKLALTFQNGRMTGDGSDYVGPFLISGRYAVEDGKCFWTKQYIGRHQVHYQGYNEGKGIWGTWEIRREWSGGFHIWPEGMADQSAKREAKSEPHPAAVSFENEAPSLEPSAFSGD